jgi:hypothetical protein
MTTTTTRSRKWSMILAVFFTALGLLVSLELVTLASKFNTYVTSTMARDTAQEACAQATLIVLRQWAKARIADEGAQHQRDTAMESLLTEMAAGKPVNPVTAQRALATLHATQVSRDTMLSIDGLPECHAVE